MTDDIVARLREEQFKFAVVPRENKLEMSPQTVGRLALLWREAADEIERLREQVKHHARDRFEYCAAWLKWIEWNDGLDIAQWCRAYADAIPYPNSDGLYIASVIHSRLDARHRMAADEIERLRERIRELEESK